MFPTINFILDFNNLEYKEAMPEGTTEVRLETLHQKMVPFIKNNQELVTCKEARIYEKNDLTELNFINCEELLIYTKIEDFVGLEDILTKCRDSPKNNLKHISFYVP